MSELDFILDFIRQHYRLNRTPANPDTDILAEAISRHAGGKVIESKAGEECLTWITPMHWKVHEAYIATVAGEKVVDYENHPLHLWSHSVAFHGRVSRQELESHLYTDADHPEWIPFHYSNSFKFDVRDWGFCLSHCAYEQLTDAEYDVHIDADLDTAGSMKVNDVLIKGESGKTILFSAHTCHPGQVTDGLSNIAVLLALHDRLKNAKRLRYSYRFVFGPEYFAAAAFLDKTPPADVENIVAGVYLDFVGNGLTPGFQTSFPGGALPDRVIENVFQATGHEFLRKGYRKLAGNDEMFYNGQGFWIPMIGVAAETAASYHHDADNMENLDEQQLVDTLELLTSFVDVFETDYVPCPKYRGPLYLYRYDLMSAVSEWREQQYLLERMQVLMNGKRSCFEIAEMLNTDFFFVRTFCDTLKEKGLLEARKVDLLADARGGMSGS